MTTFDGSVYRITDSGYEKARRAAVWNAIKPKRKPAVIVVAGSRDDVVRAVELARAEKLSIGIRSGGHSWVGNAVRDDGLLLDLSRLKAIEVDPGSMTATIEPGVHADELAAALSKHNLYFPTGHCPSVGIAGFILGGGSGLTSYSSDVGPAAFSLRAIDVVTADGETVHATDDENSEILWAARGSGSGFFAAVTRLYLDLRPMPGVVARAIQVHPLSAYDELVPWYLETNKVLMEAGCPAMLIAGRNPLSDSDDTVLMVTTYVFADDIEHAKALMAPLGTAPGLDSALLWQPAQPCSIAELYGLFSLLHPEGYRYLTDNVFLSDQDDPQLWRDTKAIIDSLPTARSSVWLIPGLQHTHPNAAYSLFSETLIEVYAGYEHESQDEEMIAWHTASVESIDRYTIGGGYVGDSNLFRHPMAVLHPDSAARLEELWSKYDPEGRFFRYPSELPLARV
ncbi:FAD-binding oxidoreductase [Nocardia sp. NPDC051900]|uniref:FAD-binding oxidoreductase n=1 Tax=Nocardia sp. NPDC051900 TaxID=3364326 RepID=UPI0037AB07A6